MDTPKGCTLGGGRGVLSLDGFNLTGKGGKLGGVGGSEVKSRWVQVYLHMCTHHSTESECA